MRTIPMQQNNDQIRLLSIHKLFSEHTKYIIPLYQRNYEWGIAEIEQLISDIQNAQESSIKNYYIGSLVVARRKNGSFEVIDGQQRLTTLNILRKSLNSSVFNNLEFEHRQAAQNALLNDEAQNIDLDPSIIQGFKCTKQILLNRNIDDSFQTYLNNNVMILRIEVPEHTDLNHYFEVMNTRGEQLEKHEILKARLMQKLNYKKGEQKAFAVLWDACSDMSRFAISGFPSPKLREKLFGKKLDKLPEFEELIQSLQENRATSEVKDIETILNDKRLTNLQTTEEKTFEDEGKLGSIIDFPNFLMHVLAVWQKQGKKNLGEISLDEKFLLKSFEPIKQAKEIKEFASLLLKCRLLFDRYILKMDNRKEDNTRWAILQPAHSAEKTVYAKETFEKSAKLDKLKMLQAMFQVSFTARNYKDWLQKALNYLYQHQDKIQRKSYIKYLENLAKEEYQKRSSELAYPKIQHYIFNYLDYRILCAYHQGKKSENWTIFPDNKEIKHFEPLKKALDEFEFFNRSSVEHYYPQTSINVWQKKTLNGLGNLCLIGQSHNAKLSNRYPEEKRDYVLQRLNSNTAESCKQLLMMMYQEWNEQSSKEHEKKMIQLLNE